MLNKNYHGAVKKEIETVLSTLINEELPINEKVNSLEQSAKKLEGAHFWKTTTESNETKSKKWQ